MNATQAIQVGKALSATMNPVELARLASAYVQSRRQERALRGVGSAAAGEQQALTALLAAGLAVVVGLLVVRGTMGYYVGKRLGRPKAGAVTGAIFGAPGMGVLSLLSPSR
jgi:hypothetical protein